MNLSLVLNYTEDQVLHQYLVLCILLELVLSAAELQAVSTSSHGEYLWDALHTCFVLIRDQNNPVTRICHLLRDL